MAASTKSKKNETKTLAFSDRSNALVALEKKLAEQGFDQRLELDAAEEGQACSMVWGTHRGVETPRVFLLRVACRQLGKGECRLRLSAFIYTSSDRSGRGSVRQIRRCD